jgi:hypothetical protein
MSKYQKLNVKLYASKLHEILVGKYNLNGEDILKEIEATDPLGVVSIVKYLEALVLPDSRIDEFIAESEKIHSANQDEARRLLSVMIDEYNAIDPDNLLLHDIDMADWSTLEAILAYLKKNVAEHSEYDAGEHKTRFL